LTKLILLNVRRPLIKEKSEFRIRSFFKKCLPIKQYILFLWISQERLLAGFVKKFYNGSDFKKSRKIKIIIKITAQSNLCPEILISSYKIYYAVTK
jgi:hypothetical protein